MLALSIFLGAILGGSLCFWLWGQPSAIACIAALLCLALGFWITELLISALTGVKKLNVPALVMLISGKFAWWASLFLGAKHLPHGVEGGVAIGLGAFLLAVVLSGLSQYGVPRISNGNT
jgi:hypothetical protein